MVAEAETSPVEGVTIPDALPVLPLRGGTIVYPLAVVPLLVGQPRSVRLIDDVMRRDRLIAVVAQRNDETTEAGPEDLHRVGTVGMVHQLFRGNDGSIRIVVQGLERIRLLDFVSTDPYLVARIEQYPDRTVPGVETEGLRRAVVDLYRRLVGLVQGLPDELATAAEQLADPRQVAYLVASTIPLDSATRQEILDLDPVDAKLRRLVELLQRELAVREIGQRITDETQERMTKTQREYYLREQLRSIQQELGEEGGADAEIAELRRRLEEATLPPEARREVDRELSRLGTIPQASPEHGIIRTYLEWMADLPWDQVSGGEIDVRRARQVLDEDHYDLEKIKDRILEYLAVRKLRQDRLTNLEAERVTPANVGVDVEGQGEVDTPLPNTEAQTPTDRAAREPILCFVGPPGVGKTSLGQSIARSLGRKFVRISLGGVHDEAEIRGHRRTYIGALPGRFIQALRRAETRDPVFMLDEIDKVGADWRGDPSSALLEVLDPAQNHSFVDNYLGVPFDLSQVLFIATANTLDTIPGPLQDRMEVLQLSGYTDDEKVQIARKYLVPKQITAHGLTPEEVSFDDKALRVIVRSYTREAGVRNLERQIATVCRKIARDIAEGATRIEPVTAERVVDYLGRPRFFDEVAERTDRPGVATGLAWTPTGGDVLFVEATMMPSHEERLILTGMLGDVMRESAQAALSYVRSNAGLLGVDAAVFDGKAVHLHVPAGAIPKDGPSAGITMVTALTSLASGRPVRNDVAMTGEITLRGKVLPIGGLREKSLAAHRAGIETIIIPRRNERDLEDVPAELRQELEFVLVDSAEEVVRQALQGEPARSTVAAVGAA
ncbi:MAG: ATP-dependent Lon protease [Thermomicrobiales bacterium]|nr:ATP-dependent Lon protease [Thermomicrobiales bacterium]MEA2523157.1 ATP-dependent Lon protease [Thermomicrobiales bacterium]MEA2594441.1 ATP-dependent Lon protease [Thermomicrobiales bacterium]